MSHTATADAHADGQLHVHVMPIPVLIGVWAALMIFTFLTVTLSYFDFGVGDLLIAMGIATVKAFLVILYFMHLRYDKPFNAMIFLSSVGFVSLFIVLSLMDTSQNQPTMDTRDKTPARDTAPTATPAKE
jgi:cytochrome c oxidase subunit 4